MVILLNRQYADNGIRCQQAADRSLATRLTMAVERAFLIGRLNLIYNKKQILFLNEYKSDLLTELRELESYNKTKSTDGNVIDPDSVITDRYVMIRTAKYMLGEAESLPQDFIEILSTYFSDKSEIFTYLRYLVMKSMAVTEQSNFFAKTNVFGVYQMGLEVQGYNTYEGGVQFEYTPSDEQPNLIEYASSFKCCDTITEMMSFYHHLCVLIPENFGSNMHITLHDAFDTNKGIECIYNAKPYVLRDLLDLITKLRKNNPLPLGKVAYAVTKRCEDLKIGSTDGEEPMAEVTEAMEGFDLEEIMSYNDVDLESEMLAISLEDLSDDDSDEDSDPDDDPSEDDLDEDGDLESDDDLEDEDDLGSDDDDDLGSDDDLGADDDDLDDEDDSDDGESDDDEEEEEEPVKVIPKSDAEATGAKAIVVSFEREHTADSYTYRSELGKRINEVLDNEQNDLTVDQRTILKNLRSRYLFLWSVETINEVLTKVVGIKLTKK